LARARCTVMCVCVPARARRSESTGSSDGPPLFEGTSGPFVPRDASTTGKVGTQKPQLHRAGRCAGKPKPRPRSESCCTSNQTPSVQRELRHSRHSTLYANSQKKWQKKMAAHNEEPEEPPSSRSLYGYTIGKGRSRHGRAPTTKNPKNPRLEASMAIL
jgi:hypothetical protein